MEIEENIEQIYNGDSDRGNASYGSRLANFIKVLKAQDEIISEFDGSLWGSMIEFVTVGRNKEVTVTFRDGTEIRAEMALSYCRVPFFVER